MRLGHVNLYVRNAERSRDWYAKVLGLHTYHYRPGRAAFMSADREISHEIALIQVGETAPAPTRGQVGLSHMAWMVESLDALVVAYQRLKDNDIRIDAIVDHGISLGIYFRDPDGHGLELTFEQPRAEWPRQEQVFADDVVKRGLFPGPWDNDPAAVRH